MQTLFNVLENMLLGVPVTYLTPIFLLLSLASAYFWTYCSVGTNLFTSKRHSNDGFWKIGMLSFVLGAVMMFFVFIPYVTVGLSSKGPDSSDISAVVSYYFIVAGVEETAKFIFGTIIFSILNIFYIKRYGIGSYDKHLLFINCVIFAAIGFTVYETFLYVSHSQLVRLPSGESIISFGKAFGTFFSRNLFAISIHVICSYAFAKLTVDFIKKGRSLPVSVLYGLACAVTIHQFTNTYITLGLTPLLNMAALFVFGWIILDIKDSKVFLEKNY